MNNKEIRKYDEYNRIIYYKDVYDYEFWYKYDENGYQLEIKRKAPDDK